MVSLDLEARLPAEADDRLRGRLLHHGKALVGTAGIRPGDRVLEIGCGTGHLAEFVARIVGPQGRVVGLDPRTVAIDIARRRTLPNFTACVGTADDLYLLENASFDVVLMNSMFHWIQNQEQSLAEAARVLRQGGRIGISALAKKPPHTWQVLFDEVFRSAGLGDSAGRPWISAYRLDSDELSHLLAKVGFQATSVGLRPFVDYFADVGEVIDFEFSALNSLGNSTGNFFAGLPAEKRAKVRAALAHELGAYETPSGIRLDRHMIFALARKLWG